MSRAVWVDYAAAPEVAAMEVVSMTVLERVVREAARAGATRVLVRGDAARLPAVAVSGVEVEVVPPATVLPADARAIPGDVVGGVRITDAASRRRARGALMQACRRPYDGVGDRYIVRPVSLRLTPLFAATGVTPNQVTLVNIAIGIAACVAAMIGTPTAVVAAGALMWCQVVIDSCDGELARVMYQHSAFGMYLDNASDDGIDNLFIAALGIGLGGAWAAIGVTAALLRSACALMIYRRVARAGRPGDVTSFHWWFEPPDDGMVERFEPKLTPLAVLRSTARRDLYCVIWTALCLADLPRVALAMSLPMCVAYFGLAVADTIVTARRARGSATAAPAALDPAAD